MAASSKKNPTGKKWTGFRPWKTLKDGTRIYAKDYGYKAWPIGKSR